MSSKLNAKYRPTCRRKAPCSSVRAISVWSSNDKTRRDICRPAMLPQLLHLGPNVKSIIQRRSPQSGFFELDSGTLRVLVVIVELVHRQLAFSSSAGLCTLLSCEIIPRVSVIIVIHIAVIRVRRKLKLITAAFDSSEVM